MSRVIFRGPQDLAVAVREHLLTEIPLCRDYAPVLVVETTNTSLSLPDFVAQYSTTLEHVYHAIKDFTAGWKAAKKGK